MWYQILHRCLTRLIDSFHEFEDIMCVTVDYRDANIIVIFILDHDEHSQLRSWQQNTHGVRILPDPRGPSGKNVRRIKLRIHGVCLASVNHE